MAQTDFDVIINGVKAKIKKAEQGGYTKRTVRREIENNLLSQAENPAMVSRFDQRQFFQTSWAGGSRWWKPLITPTDLDSYFQANHMDVWSEPGKVVPGNKLTDAANTQLHDNCVIGIDNAGDVYAIGSTALTNASFLDVYSWLPSSNAFTRETTFHSGIPVAENPISMVFDDTDGYFYVLNADGNEITRFNPSTPAQDAAWLSSVTVGNSSVIMLHREGLLVMDVDAGIRLVDKSGTPSTSIVFNDGLGSDLLREPSLGGTNPIIRRTGNAVVSPEGVYYAKNTLSQGTVIAYVLRVEKDSAGNWIGNPIATLPTGTVVLSMAYHLGNIILATSPDWRTIVRNDTDEAEIVLYNVSTQSGISTLGSVLGGRDEVDETPYALLGSYGSLLYLGGHKRLWVYDAVRGGIHSAFAWTTELSNGAYVAMAFADDSNGDTVAIFLGRDRLARTHLSQVDDPDTVAAFGDDETHYTLTSNFFDGGLPMESKELTKVAIQREAGDGDQEWTVQVSADGGTFADALVHSTTGERYAEADLSGTSGRRFQYRLIYQTKDTNRNALEAVLVAFTTGELVTEWDLILDGTEFLNVDNEVQDEETFYDNMVTLAGTQTLVNFSDNLKEQGRETDSDTTVKVKVMAVEIVKSKAGESDAIRVVVREA